MTLLNWHILVFIFSQGILNGFAEYGTENGLIIFASGEKISVSHTEKINSRHIEKHLTIYKHRNYAVSSETKKGNAGNPEGS